MHSLSHVGAQHSMSQMGVIDERGPSGCARCGVTREQSHAHSVDSSVLRRDARAESCTQCGRIGAAAQYWSSGSSLRLSNGGMESDLDGAAYFAAAVSGSWSAVVNSGAV
jgi:hypothetical protein